MIDYMVHNRIWLDYCVFATEGEAREYIANCLATYPEDTDSDYTIYKRERIA